MECIAHRGPLSRLSEASAMALALFGGGCAAFTSGGPVGQLAAARRQTPTQIKLVVRPQLGGLTNRLSLIHI